MNPPARTRPKKRVFFEGRYRKLVRDLPQTIFYCPECKGRGCDRCEGFGKLTRDSVQELIARVAMPRFKAGKRSHKFHGAGREDIDVRMLGGGRPFVFEVVNPKIADPDLVELETRINELFEGRIEVIDLRWTDRKRVPEVKELRSPKEYGALVASEEPADLAPLHARVGERIAIVQRTPARVSHRRADLERQRWIQIEEIEEQGPCAFQVRVRSQHGTYIKEAISSDGGRTQPSISELVGVPCRCEVLDVLNMLPPEPEPEPLER